MSSPAMPSKPSRSSVAPKSRPANPSTPVRPVTPARVNTPARPPTPVKPAPVVAPVTPARSSTPSRFATPVRRSTTPAPTTPARPAASARPITPARPVTPAQISTPTRPATPARPVTPAQISTPTRPATPARPVTPATPIRRITSSTPATPVKAQRAAGPNCHTGLLPDLTRVVAQTQRLSGTWLLSHDLTTEQVDKEALRIARHGGSVCLELKDKGDYIVVGSYSKPQTYTRAAADRDHELSIQPILANRCTRLVNGVWIAPIWAKPRVVQVGHLKKRAESELDVEIVDLVSWADILGAVPEAILHEPNHIPREKQAQRPSPFKKGGAKSSPISARSPKKGKAPTVYPVKNATRELAAEKWMVPREGRSVALLSPAATPEWRSMSKTPTSRGKQAATPTGAGSSARGSATPTPLIPSLSPAAKKRKLFDAFASGSVLDRRHIPTHPDRLDAARGDRARRVSTLGFRKYLEEQGYQILVSTEAANRLESLQLSMLDDRLGDRLTRDPSKAHVIVMDSRLVRDPEELRKRHLVVIAARGLGHVVEVGWLEQCWEKGVFLDVEQWAVTEE